MSTRVFQHHALVGLGTAPQMFGQWAKGAKAKKGKGAGWTRKKTPRKENAEHKRTYRTKIGRKRNDAKQYPTLWKKRRARFWQNSKLPIEPEAKQQKKQLHKQPTTKLYSKEKERIQSITFTICHCFLNCMINLLVQYTYTWPYLYVESLPLTHTKTGKNWLKRHVCIACPFTYEGLEQPPSVPITFRERRRVGEQSLLERALSRKGLAPSCCFRNRPWHQKVTTSTGPSSL